MESEGFFISKERWINHNHYYLINTFPSTSKKIKEICYSVIQALV